MFSPGSLRPWWIYNFLPYRDSNSPLRRPACRQSIYRLCYRGSAFTRKITEENKLMSRPRLEPRILYKSLGLHYVSSVNDEHVSAGRDAEMYISVQTFRPLAWASFLLLIGKFPGHLCHFSMQKRASGARRRNQPAASLRLHILMSLSWRRSSGN
jgi:hypothetical protein